MTTTRWSTFLVVAVVGFAAAWLGLSAGQANGWVLLAPPSTLIAVTALLAIGTLAAAWPLRRWNNGVRDRPINPLRAARTLVLAKAAGLTGAALSGVWLAAALFVLPRLDVGAQADRVVANVFAVAVSGGLLIAGALGERWCRIPPEDDGTATDGIRAPGSTA